MNETEKETAKKRFTVYMGALSCMRHRGREFHELQSKGELAYLIMDEIDFITGSYLDELEQTVIEMYEKHKPDEICIAAGCQATLLSTDFEMIENELGHRLGVKVTFDRNCHLMGFRGKGGGHGGHEHGHGEGGRDRHGHGEWRRDRGGDMEKPRGWHGEHGEENR